MWKIQLKYEATSTYSVICVCFYNNAHSKWTGVMNCVSDWPIILDEALHSSQLVVRTWDVIVYTYVHSCWFIYVCTRMMVYTRSTYSRDGLFHVCTIMMVFIHVRALIMFVYVCAPMCIYTRACTDQKHKPPSSPSRLP